MNPASTNNMSTRDVPTEMQRRNAERQQRREAVARLVAITDALAFALVAGICVLLRTCVK